MNLFRKSLFEMNKLQNEEFDVNSGNFNEMMRCYLSLKVIGKWYVTLCFTVQKPLTWLHIYCEL